MNKLLVGAVILLAAYSAGSTVLLLRQRTQLESTTSQAEQTTAVALEAEKSKAKAEVSEKIAQEAQRRVAVLENELRAAQTASDAKPGNGTRAAETSQGAHAGGSTAQNENQEPSALELETARLTGLHASAKIQRQYGPFFRQLNLSPEKAAAVTQLLVDKKQAANDLAAGALKGGDDVVNNPEDFGDLVSAAKQGVEDQIKSLLGDSDYAAYQAYNRSLGRSNAIQQLQQSLANSGAPLSHDQVEQLDQTMQKNNVGHLNQKVINQSKPFLTPVQTQVLQNQLAEQKAAARLRALPPPATQPVAVKPRG